MPPVIAVENLSKCYRLGTIGGATLREDFARWTAKLCRKPDPTLKIGQEHHSRLVGKEFWALDDVSFQVEEGEILGIIGRNGAGKSTLLKILSRVTAPSSGQVKIRGRVASLLEVGTGFHPELTGRENVFLNGAILGMTKAEIRKKFDEIVAFSEVEEFIDTPVKRYSSGMYVRLAFAVAAHLEPEILIVDEVLAVGDAQFQKKCLGKMGDVASHGRTILFVSHNMTAVKTLCSQGLLLSNGSAVSAGPITDVINHYVAGASCDVVSRAWPTPHEAPGGDGWKFKTILLEPRGRAIGAITVNDPFDLVVELWSSRPGSVNLSLQFNLLSGEVVCAVGSPASAILPGTARYVCHVPGDLLNDGVYTVNVMIVEDGSFHFMLPEALAFEIHDPPRAGSWVGKWPGLVRPKMQWDYTQQ